MSNVIVNSAEIIRNKYKLEIDGCFNAAEFFRAKQINDVKKAKKICKNLYKKVKNG